MIDRPRPTDSDEGGLPGSLSIRGPARAGAASGLALLALLALGGCTSPDSEPAGGESPVIRVLPFEVEGQREGAAFLGRAFANSLAICLDQARDVRVTEPSAEGGELAESDPPAGEATHRMTGTLTREDRAVHVRLQLRDAASESVVWEGEASSDTGRLSSLVFALARGATRAMNVPYPELYGSMDDLRAGPEMSESSLWADAMNWRGYDNERRLRNTSELVERFDDDPSAHVVDAWSLMLAWDATPASENYLVRLRERLDALQVVDPSSPYDELMLGYVYKASGQPDQALALHSRALRRTDLSNAARAWALRLRSLTHLQVGNAAAARLDADEAAELDPANALSLIALSKSLETLGELEEAIVVSKQALMLEPFEWRHHQRLGLVLARAGRFDEGAESIDRACQLSASQEPCANLSVTLQRAGRDEEARAAAEHAASLAATAFGRYNLACYRALSGRETESLDELRRAVELGFTDVLITSDPDLDSLRSNPAFEEIVTEVRERLSVRRRLSGSVFPWQA